MDDLDITYCSCRQEGRGVELSNEGIYTCCLCGKEIYIHKQWNPRRNLQHINTQNNRNHALNLKQIDEFNTNKE